MVEQKHDRRPLHSEVRERSERHLRPVAVTGGEEVIEKEAVIILPPLIRDSIRDNNTNNNTNDCISTSGEKISLSLSLLSFADSQALQNKVHFSKEFPRAR